MRVNRIECCLINRLNGSDELLSSLEEKENVRIETFNCIGNCLICSTKFHAILNGKRYVADTPDELKKLIVSNL